MVYLPTFGEFLLVDVGKYTDKPYIECLGKYVNSSFTKLHLAEQTKKGNTLPIRFLNFPPTTENPRRRKTISRQLPKA